MEQIRAQQARVLLQRSAVVRRGIEAARSREDLLQAIGQIDPQAVPQLSSSTGSFQDLRRRGLERLREATFAARQQQPELSSPSLFSIVLNNLRLILLALLLAFGFATASNGTPSFPFLTPVLLLLSLLRRPFRPD